MSLRTKIKTLLAKVESVYGTDPTPDGTSNAILVKALTIDPLTAELTSRDLIRSFLGNSDTVVAQKYVTIEFEVELAGAITKGIAPAYGPLLRGCGFAETLNTASVSITRSSSTATVTYTAHGLSVGDSVKISGCTQTEYNGVQTVVSIVDADNFTFTVSGTPATPATGTPVISTTAVYAPISSSFESLTLYFNVDGLRHKATGCYGSVEFGLSVKQFPTMKFKFLGIYNAPTDTATPSCVYTAFNTPKIASTTFTSSFSLLSYSGKLESLNLNMANDVQYRTLIGSESVIFTDRKPSGTMVIEAPTIASKDYFTAAVNGSTGTFTVTHGTATGNICILAAPRVSIGNPTYQDSQGVQMLSLPFVPTPSSGNDEVTLTVK